MKYIIVIFTLLYTFTFQQAFAENTQEATYLLRGRVLSVDTNQPLVNASITVQQTNVSIVTNQDGYFSLRVPRASRHSQLIIRHLGYENYAVPVVTLINRPNNNIRLTPTNIELDEVRVLGGDGSELIREALRRIPRNFSNEPNMMVAFYRESIRRGNNRFVSLVEAVVDVHKAAYNSFSSDQARIYIGRRATDILPRDTLLLRFQGGITGALMLDVAKHPENVFYNAGEEYIFTITGMTSINDKPHYVITFQQRPYIDNILFRGTVFLDAETLAFARMEFYKNVEGRRDASGIFIRRMPTRMEVEFDRARYTVDFIEDNGTWFFNYSSMEIDFRVRWRNRLFGLFARNYSIRSEMAITDRCTDEIERFSRRERIRTTDIIAERVGHFEDPYFWGEYTVIEPEQDITEAIRRLSGRLQRRSR
jgi:hypothetical protein